MLDNYFAFPLSKAENCPLKQQTVLCQFCHPMLRVPTRAVDKERGRTYCSQLVSRDNHPFHATVRPRILFSNTESLSALCDKQPARIDTTCLIRHCFLCLMLLLTLLEGYAVLHSTSLADPLANQVMMETYDCNELIVPECAVPN